MKLILNHSLLKNSLNKLLKYSINKDKLNEKIE